MSHFNNSLAKFRRFLIFLLPAALFLSAFPQISFGATDSMNFELSLPELWLVFFSVASLLNLPKIWRASRRLFLQTALFPLFATLSLFWSANPLRGFLTTGLLWLVWFSVWNLVFELRAADRLYRVKLQQVFFLTSLLFAGVCWLQCLLDLLGVPRETSLLCLGCTSASFGFPHPNGLTLEPQFMGNLLLAPALFSLHLYLKKRHRSTLFLFGFFSATLFLTFSRGAIYAFIVAFAARLAYEIYKTRTTKNTQFGSSLLTIPIIILSFIFTLCCQGLFAQLGPTSDTFLSATTKAIHHLSLGRLDFRPSITKSPLDAESTESSSVPIFDGYVAESTDIRLDLTSRALKIWRSSPRNLLLGTGLGSAGVELYRSYPELGSPKEIVQNEYASLLLELGLLGWLCLLITFAPFWRRLSVLEFAYLLTLFFFSGLPNAFHIYLFPPLLRSPQTQTSRKPKSSKS